VLGLSLMSVIVAAAPSEPAVAAGVRYVDPLFDVDVTEGIVYATEPSLTDGRPETVRLDVYQPRGDTLAERPAIVVIHGGGFVGGSRSQLADIAGRWARRGYVTISIDYRLDPGAKCQAVQDGLVPPERLAAETERCRRGIETAQHDAHGAIRWLRANAATYRVDPTRIAALGGSAGAVTAVHVAQRSDTPGTTGEHDGQDPTVRAALAMSGCNYDPPSIGPGDAPVSLLASEFDQAVPFGCVLDTAARARAAGLGAHTISYLGEGTHAAGLYRKYQDEVDRSWTEFLIDHLMLDARARAGSRTVIAGSPGRSAFVSVIATRTSGPGYVQALGCDGTPGSSSNVNTDAAGQTRAGLALVAFDDAGTACLYTHGTAHLVADLQSYVASDAVDDVDDLRLLDTRTGSRPDAGSLTVISGRPSSSAVVSIVATESARALYVQAVPCDARPGSTSNLNIDAVGQTRSGLAVVKFDTAGRSCVFVSASTHLVVDLQGYLAPGAFDDVDDTRVLDTRNGPRPGDGAVREIIGRPNGSGFVSVVATETTAPLFVQVLPCGTTPGATSNVNADRAGATVAGAAIVRFDERGRACVYTNRATHLVVDLQGWFATSAINDIADQRILDTRAT
jgi:dienelactone hydrolase